MSRGDGGIAATKRGLKPLLDNLDAVAIAIKSILKIKGLEGKEFFIFQSRAMGTNKPDSDFDIYVQLVTQHANWIEEKGVNIYEGKQKNQFSGNWHPLSLEPIDPYSLKWYWPHKVFHDTQAIEWYTMDPSIQPHILEILDKMGIHITYGVHPEPPRKKEYGSHRYYFSFTELMRMAKPWWVD